jgi:hypothetical protein
MIKIAEPDPVVSVNILSYFRYTCNTVTALKLRIHRVINKRVGED